MLIGEICGPNLEDHSLELEAWGSKVQQEPSFATRCLQVVEQLRLLFGCQCIQGFDFDNDVGVAGELRGRCSPEGTLEDDPENSPLDHSFFKAAGVEVITAEYTDPEIKSKQRQVMNQADIFYYSGHGSHSDGSLANGLKPADVAAYWGEDIDIAIFAGCSVLDINDYNNNYSGAAHTASPGKLWNSVGPGVLLGYAYLASLDSQNSDGIVSAWASNRAAQGDTLAWMNANDNSNGRNACAIEKDSKYFYFHRTSIFGVPVNYTLTTILAADW